MSFDGDQKLPDQVFVLDFDFLVKCLEEWSCLSGPLFFPESVGHWSFSEIRFIACENLCVRKFVVLFCVHLPGVKNFLGVVESFA